VYPKAGQGYLFHDTEDVLEFKDIQKALWTLSGLHENSSTVVALRVDPNTIAASFNTTDFPFPRKKLRLFANDGEYEYLAQTRLSGWVLNNINDPGSEAAFVEFDDVYDDCTRLERFTGHCPCSALAEGTCLPITAYARFPVLTDTKLYNNLDLTVYKRKRYQEVQGFEYVSGALTTELDFNDAIRPWDNHNFEAIYKRKKELAERGADSARRFAHRKIECPQCVFSYKKYDGTVKDCGLINNCKSHVLESTAWDVLFRWLHDSTPMTEGTASFTTKQIRYLIHASGTCYTNRAITPARNTETILAGFRLTSGKLYYEVAAAKGDLQRYKKFDNYEELQKMYPLLPRANAVPDVEIHAKHVLAHAIFATKRTIHGSGHQPHPQYAITFDRGSVVQQGCTTRSKFVAAELHPGSSVESYYNLLRPTLKVEANNYANNTMPVPFY
jgi:hypothetical protein